MSFTELGFTSFERHKAQKIVRVDVAASLDDPAPTPGSTEPGGRSRRSPHPPGPLPLTPPVIPPPTSTATTVTADPFANPFTTPAEVEADEAAAWITAARPDGSPCP